MYPADHLLLSATAGLAFSHKFKLPFVPLASLLMLMNLIDLDHHLYYYLDDGGANSLTLHPLHIYAGVIMTLVGLYALYKVEYLPWVFCIIWGIALHLFADAVAYGLDYHIPTLLALSLFNLILYAYVAKIYLPPELLTAYMAFGLIFVLTSHSLQAFIAFGIGVEPQNSHIPWLTADVIYLSVTACFYGIFTKKYRELRNT